MNSHKEIIIRVFFISVLYLKSISVFKQKVLKLWPAVKYISLL